MKLVTYSKDEAASASRRSLDCGVLTEAGLIDVGRSKSPVACNLVDMSITGARLKLQVPEPKAFERSVEIPGRFTLLLRFDRIEADCQLVWRRGNELGVRFLGPPRTIRMARG